MQWSQSTLESLCLLQDDPNLRHSSSLTAPKEKIAKVTRNLIFQNIQKKACLEMRTNRLRVSRIANKMIF